ncbi:MAG: arginine decarboxylase, pyruvoyl-dependent [Proteobacteria bacterium]|nr:arginine decarboxylase, pyruvoyl-dependent [Pseudomonadota bacterium]
MKKSSKKNTNISKNTFDFVPKKVFFTKGVGHHTEELASFELALRDAGIEKYNLVTVSSIFPPHCEIIDKEEGLKLLNPGQVVFCVMSKLTSNEPHRLIVASVGCAIPKERNNYGYLSEYHAYGENEREAGDYAEDLATMMLATTLGIEFDEDASWDEKRQIWRISDKIVISSSIAQEAIVQKKKYTTVLSAAVFVF